MKVGQGKLLTQILFSIQVIEDIREVFMDIHSIID